MDMFSRILNSPSGDFRFSISAPQRSNGRWSAVLRIEAPREQPRELSCLGVDLLDCVLYGVKLAAANVRAYNDDGFGVQWLGGDDCGFEYGLAS